MLVKFDQMLKRNANERTNTAGENWNPDYDPYKILNKVNNYKEVKPPNFDLMTSRPNDDGCLPSFMKVY